MRISDWSSDVCSSDLPVTGGYFVFFEDRSAELTPDARAVVARVADDAAAVRPAVVRVTGYTRRAGATAETFRLAERRTNAVAEALAAGGVPPEQIRREPVGQAVASTIEPSRRGDRRVEIVFADRRSEERRVGKECGSTCRSRW